MEAFEDQQEKEENFREEQQDKAKKSTLKYGEVFKVPYQPSKFFTSFFYF